ncbi:hypothetical protein C8J56DRAFT_769687 [Mycena floridula]|nr:hypothetical protein C8J56DRAFT_769687 [Mycena floridula]
MKVFTATAFTAALYALIVSAQSVNIGFPADGAQVKAGQSLVVEVDRPDTISSSQEVAIVIGFSSCSSRCLPPLSSMGTVLYNGPYAPIFQPNQTVAKPPHQNFTVTIPTSATVGKAQLNLAHFLLLGASLGPFLETRNISLNVVG